MLDVIDFLLGPLFKFNPFKYAFDRDYRAKKQDELGKEAKYVFRYQVIFAIVSTIVLVMVLMYMFE